MSNSLEYPKFAGEYTLSEHQGALSSNTYSFELIKGEGNLRNDVPLSAKITKDY